MNEINIRNTRNTLVAKVTKHIATITQIGIFLSLLFCGKILYQIEKQLSSIPKTKDYYADLKVDRPSKMKDAIWNAPLVHVGGGEVTVDGYVTVDGEVEVSGEVEVTNEVDISGEVEIDQSPLYPVPVKIKR